MSTQTKKKPTKKAPAPVILDDAPVVVDTTPIVESERPIEDIIKDRFEFSKHQMGVKVADDTPLEEILPAFDYLTKWEKNIGFILGDVLVFAEDKFGERFTWAMEKSGRALSTVKNYAVVARAFPHAMRQQPQLTFSHYQQVTRIADKKEDVKELLKTAADKKAPLTVKELAAKVKKDFPKPKPKARPIKPIKHKRNPPNKKEIKPYDPDEEETKAIDGLFKVLDLLNEILEKNVTPRGKGWAALYIGEGEGKDKRPAMDNASKRGLLKALAPAVELHKRVEFKTGY